MKPVLLCCLLTHLFLGSCKNNQTDNNLINKTQPAMDSITVKSGYSDVNGINMYYEVYGHGQPLVLLHGGGSTIQTSFAKIIPQLSNHYQVIAVVLQNHGRSGFRGVPQTFEQDADDVATLLKNLTIEKADFFGFSNG